MPTVWSFWPPVITTAPEAGPIRAPEYGQIGKARDTRLDRIVAIKTSPAQFSERFAREVRSIAALNHPNICILHDVGPDYLVMKFVEGVPVLPTDSPRKLLDLAVQMSECLAPSHAAGIVHRDLKPDNILITRAPIKSVYFPRTRGAGSKRHRWAKSAGVDTFGAGSDGCLAGLHRLANLMQAPFAHGE